LQRQQLLKGAPGKRRPAGPFDRSLVFRPIALDDLASIGTMKWREFIAIMLRRALVGFAIFVAVCGQIVP
jgi:hypothetical protein